MKRDYRLIPIWFWPIVVLIGFLLLNMCGCKTGGKWVGSGSTGAKQIIIPSELQQQPDGTYRIKPKESQPVEVKSTPVEIKSAITRPELPEPKSATAEDLPPEKIKAAGVPTPFKPTVTNIKLEEKVNVKPIKKNPPTNLTAGDGGRVKIEPKEQAPPEKSKVIIRWMELFAFYFLVGMLLVFVWIVIDIWKEYKKAKVDKKVKKNLTKPALGKKKKPAKRGRPKKKTV